VRKIQRSLDDLASCLPNRNVTFRETKTSLAKSNCSLKAGHLGIEEARREGVDTLTGVTRSCGFCSVARQGISGDGVAHGEPPVSEGFCSDDLRDSFDRVKDVDEA